MRDREEVTAQLDRHAQFMAERAAIESLPTLALLWFATLHELRHPPQIVKKLLLAGSLFVVFGESNCGKTFWILDLALAVASGRPWRGRQTRRGLVLYVAGEGAASVRTRVAAFRQANPEISAGLPFAIIPQPVELLDTDAVQRLIETIRAAESECGEKAVLVIFDTFARSIAGGDENSAQDVGTAVSAADLIRAETGVAVGFVHHTGKDPAKGARGSSALRAACDTEILIEGQTGQRTATATKQRDLEPGGPMPFELVAVPLGEDEDGEPISSCVVRHLDDAAGPPTIAPYLRGRSQRQFVAAMRVRSQPNPERAWTLAELRQIAREAGMTKATARSVVDVLVSTPYMTATIGGYRFSDAKG